MERFHLSRLDLMRMTWTQVVMLFDATYEGDSKEKGEDDDTRYATEQDWNNWL